MTLQSQIVCSVLSKWHHFSAHSDFGFFSCVGYLKVQGNIYDQYHNETISVCLKFAVNFRCSYTVLGSDKVSAGSIWGGKSKQMLLKAGLDLYYRAAPSKTVWCFHQKIGWPSFLRPLDTKDYIKGVKKHFWIWSGTWSTGLSQNFC